MCWHTNTKPLPRQVNGVQQWHMVNQRVNRGQRRSRPRTPLVHVFLLQVHQQHLAAGAIAAVSTATAAAAYTCLWTAFPATATIPAAAMPTAHTLCTRYALHHRQHCGTPSTTSPRCSLDRRTIQLIQHMVVQDVIGQASKELLPTGVLSVVVVTNGMPCRVMATIGRGGHGLTQQRRHQCCIHLVNGGIGLG